MMEGNSGYKFDPSRLNKALAEDFSSSASEDEDDYQLPGTQLDEDDDVGGFNPRKKRRLRKNNKEKAALGIFGSDSEDDGPRSRWKRKTLRNKSMTFVSTTAKADISDNSMDQNDNTLMPGNHILIEREESEDENDTSDEDSTGVGLGFRNGHGFAFGHSDENAKKGITDAAATTRNPDFEGESVLGMGFVPSSSTNPVLRKPDNPQRHLQNGPQISTFTTKGKVNATGFGARMMAKMGYVEGKGLGKEGQGRNIIIEANLRPQGIGLGAVKEKSEQERREEKRQAELRGEKVIDSDEEQKRRKRAKRNTLVGATSSGTSTPRRQKTKYLTAEELKASAPGLQIPEAFTPILDMTRPGSKMLTSSSGIMTPTHGVSDSPQLVEARKLVKRAQTDLQAYCEEWRNLEERKAWMDLELKEKERELEDLRSDFEGLQTFSTIIGQDLADESDLNQVLKCLQKAAEVNMSSSEIEDLAVAAIHPFLKAAEWNPVDEPAKFTSELKGLSGILIKSRDEARAVDRREIHNPYHYGIYRRHQKTTTAYESMMYKIWLPKISVAVQQWDPLMPSPILDIIENWNELLPPFVRAQVMNLVGRKLEAAVSEWNPKKKRQSHDLPHIWLFPWLQHLPPYHLDPKGTGLVSDVKRKFRQLIDVWDFDRGIVPGLKQWEEILGSQWRLLIISHVLPSIGRYLRSNFRVDPADQEPYLPILVGVMRWNQILGNATIAEVLVQNVFPMWYEKLREWLALADADLSEVAEWYSWWRGILLSDIANDKGVKMELDKGLQIMNIV